MAFLFQEYFRLRLLVYSITIHWTAKLLVITTLLPHFTPTSVKERFHALVLAPVYVPMVHLNIHPVPVSTDSIRLNIRLYPDQPQK